MQSYKRSDVPLGAGESMAHLLCLQGVDGSWEGEVVWCPAITAQVVITLTITGRRFGKRWHDGVRQYFESTQNADGGWGLHPVSHSYMFVTVLVYVALRLLGEKADSKAVTNARAWLRSQSQSIVSLPSWGKYWLSFLGLCPHEGINPVLPESFNLPRGFNLHPFRLYCHTRYIYLGFAYLYGRRFRYGRDSTIEQIRAELFDIECRAIDFVADRHVIAETDLFQRPSALVRAIYDVSRFVEKVLYRLEAGRRLRARSLAQCIVLIRGEVEATAGECISPVSGVLLLLALHANDPGDPLIESLVAGLQRWSWRDARGIRYVGARSRTWDTALAMQAILAGRDDLATMDQTAAEALRKGYRYLLGCQSQADPMTFNPDRQSTVGGWSFGDGVHNWPVSDCTAEAVVAIVNCHSIPNLIACDRRISHERLLAAADFILARQNADGGFATYEKSRGSKFLERLNPSEMFGQCMVERSYIECTGSCIEALAHLEAVPDIDSVKIGVAIRAAVEFLRSNQNEDGSFTGAWGINYIYATRFALRGFASARLTLKDRSVRRAVDWLKSKQHADGAWGEHHRSFSEGRYIESRDGLITSTSWALLGIMEFETSSTALDRGVGWLGSRRLEDGSWPREGVNGVFFGSAMLEYALYNPIFATCAVNRFRCRGTESLCE